MQRRTFLTTGAIGTAATALATPAIAQDKRQWKMVTAWPKNLPGPGVAAQQLADRITTLSGGRIEVKLFPAGELVPGRGVFDAVSEGTAELYHAVPAYWGSKSKGILLFGSQPFGLRADEQVGWMVHGGGQALYDEMYGRFGIKPFLCGNSGPQWGGWFRNEVNSAEDLKGMKFRTTGLASEMAAKMGMAAEAMSGPDMFQALQTGALDAGEFIGPWTDSALGYYQVAKNYYWPGVGEPSSAEECGVNADVFNDLPDDLKQVVQAACDSLYNQVWTEYTTKHALSLQAMVAEHGVQVKMFPEDVITGMGKAAAEVIDDLRNDDDELVKRITESFVAYRASVGKYMVYADNGQMNARNLVMGY
ncbi:MULTISPECIES: TRAP transporter substrate-binding protein [Rhodobacterales]|jgi:TRAP-type mannitol/chloroaromatic compound transport system substrate-binding protein|uniref:TRAP-type mannitol/chloroaromatic compound transport system substrate-binding protein n=1 Tax=Donghicola tyrosinivorans TaxID=1652492 RepID=A0A2T0W8P8_9RHOB|nr:MULTISPECIES: TRAP transporter substrate-binding protein [Rhodobacterales]MWD29745.1 ABC transporter substrate-binding protein [Carideicomes alvinocaridis]MDE4063455.1 TRAP transporter substrate-binding protein [Phaeobacter gallaeciensis]MDE4126478.1 TRAP transporter substrate-binding protein [Phaeobacter gallaeciensis]MDE4130953.1 TRAP transporter substrate-binding protein [Phaeobacter gallaeciensis]PRY83065.1 TRAP-type mannitol/chloroaromatic compound transport system substrate-binding pr